MKDKPCKCKLCGDITNSKFNIEFKQIPVCEGCANTIMLQQSNWLCSKAYLLPKKQ